jgi:hypothetical protein
MAITVKHSKVSTIPDEADTSLVRPSDWNADHTLTGTIDIANGGTGQTTANAAFNALVPSQTGNTGKYLTTNGTDTSWATNPLGTVTSVDLTASTGISVSGGPITTSGSITVTNTAPDQTVVLNSGTGISTSGTYPNFTVTNTAPDQTVSIASGTGISATGTYPAFTVANTGVTSAVAGTGISVSGSTGAVTVTNTAPDQTVVLTGAGTTVVTGTYPNFTITSTDSTTGTVTSVAATAGTGISVTGSPITTSGTLNITNTAPDQTVVLTAGTGISTSGTYPNFTITNTSPSLGGDVVGPASSTDNAIARFDTTTGKLLQNSVVTVGDTGAVSGVTTLSASTSVTTPIVQATNSAGLALKNSAGTTQISMGGGGGDNVTIAVATNINGANAQIDISPTGTGHVHIKPTGTGSLEIAPTNVGTMDNMTIGATTARNASVVDLSVTGTLSFDAAQGTAGQVLTSAGTGNTPTWTTPTTGTVTSVTGTAPVVSSGGNTPAISMAQATTSVDGYLSSTDWTTFNSKGNGTVTSVAALTLGTTGTDLSSTVVNGTTTPVITLQVPTASATNRGALSSADWTTFNSKAPAVTYTTNYIPYGQGTTTPNQSANLTYDGTTLKAQAVNATNGIVVNSKTVAASYTIATGDSAMSAGPITVSSGVTVTVSSGSRWVVL